MIPSPEKIDKPDIEDSENEKATDWDEFKDREIVDWKRIRLAIEHENTLTNQRVTWLLLGQGFLFGAYMAVFAPIMKGEVKEDMIPYGLASLGIIVIAGTLLSIFLSKGVEAAFDQHNKLRDWWMKRQKSNPNSHPPICGEEPHFSTFVIPYYKFPKLFLPVWALLLLFAVLRFLEQKQVNIDISLVTLILLVATALLVAFALGALYANQIAKKREG